MAWKWIAPEKDRKGRQVNGGGYRSESEAKYGAIVWATRRHVDHLDEALVETLWSSLKRIGWRVELEL